MRFQPKSEDELKDVFDAGEYDFEVFDAEEETSKKGHPMLHLSLKVFGPGGKTQFVHDYISDAFLAFKLRHFCFAVGLDQAYESGGLDADMCKHKSGKLELKVEKKEGFQERNAVVDYVVDERPANQKEAPVSASAAIEGDGTDADDPSIPF